MYDNEYFVVDMAGCTSTGEIINNLSLALETLNHSGKKIVLKLNDSHLSQSQLLSIQSLITSWGCTLDTIETINPDTWTTAENMNILVQKPIEKRVEENYQKEQSLQALNKPDDPIAIKDVNGLHFEADLDAIQKQQDNINITSDLQNAGIDPNSNFEAIDNKIANHYSLDNFAQNDIKNSMGVYKKAYDDNIASASEWEEVDFYEAPTDEPVISDSKTTTYIKQTLRSGQIFESEGNVVIIGDCHPGSEIRAVGDITVWGVLSGIAHAGYKGNIDARIRALKMNAVQLRIASCYSRRPDDTNIPYIIRSSVFTPEEARIVNNEIILYKINQN